MTNAIKWIVAIVLIWIVGRLILGLLFSVLHWAILLGLIALFAYIVYAVYKSSQRQKLRN